VLTVIAMVLAAIREWRGSIIAPITAHAINNATIITLTVFTVG
jgi:membrane protease YdiL (CAAX protease family)